MKKVVRTKKTDKTFKTNSTLADGRDHPTANEKRPKTTAEQLFEAVHKQDVLRLKALIACTEKETIQKILTQRMDAQGATALMHAASTGNLECVQILITAAGENKEAIINQKDDDGGTALFIAILYGHLDIVKALVSAGADIHLPTPECCPVYNILGFALDINNRITFILKRNNSLKKEEIKQNLLKIIDYLIQQGLRADSTSINIAEQAGVEQELQAFIKQKEEHDRRQAENNKKSTKPFKSEPSQNHTLKTNSKFKEGLAPDEAEQKKFQLFIGEISRAAQSPELTRLDLHQEQTDLKDSLEKALARGENINRVNQNGQSALHIASYIKDVAAHNLLLTHGADPSLVDKHGYTANDYWKLSPFPEPTAAKQTSTNNEAKAETSKQPTTTLNKRLAKAPDPQQSHPIIIIKPDGTAELPKSSTTINLPVQQPKQQVQTNNDKKNKTEDSQLPISNNIKVVKSTPQPSVTQTSSTTTYEGLHSSTTTHLLNQVRKTCPSFQLTKLTEVVMKKDSSPKQIQELLAAKATVSAPKHTPTPLHIAVMFTDDPKVIECLVTAKCDINGSIKNGKTPIFNAIERPDKTEEKTRQILKKLVELKADVNLASKRHTPLSLALEKSYKHIFMDLIDYGADIKQKTPSGTIVYDALPADWKSEIDEKNQQQEAKANEAFRELVDPPEVEQEPPHEIYDKNTMGEEEDTSSSDSKSSTADSSEMVEVSDDEEDEPIDEKTYTVPTSNRFSAQDPNDDSDEAILSQVTSPAQELLAELNKDMPIAFEHGGCPRDQILNLLRPVPKPGIVYDDIDIVLGLSAVEAWQRLREIYQKKPHIKIKQDKNDPNIFTITDETYYSRPIQVYCNAKLAAAVAKHRDEYNLNKARWETKKHPKEVKAFLEKLIREPAKHDDFYVNNLYRYAGPLAKKLIVIDPAKRALASIQKIAQKQPLEMIVPEIKITTQDNASTVAKDNLEAVIKNNIRLLSRDILFAARFKVPLPMERIAIYRKLGPDLRKMDLGMRKSYAKKLFQSGHAVACLDMLQHLNLLKDFFLLPKTAVIDSIAEGKLKQLFENLDNKTLKSYQTGSFYKQLTADIKQIISCQKHQQNHEDEKTELTAAHRSKNKAFHFEFLSKVLPLPPEQVTRDGATTDLSKQDALPKDFIKSDISAFHNTLKKFVLEEAGAEIARGLERSTENIPITFVKKIASTNVSHPSDNKNTMLVLGFQIRNEDLQRLKPKDRRVKPCDAFLLQYAQGKSPLFAVARYSAHNPLAKVQTISLVIKAKQDKGHGLPEEIIKNLKQQTWSLKYAGSLITQSRTYIACAQAALEPWQPEIIRGELQKHTQSRAVSSDEQQQINSLKLNPSQRKAVTAGLALEKGCLVIDGPPGTGKSTVVTALLSQLDAYYETPVQKNALSVEKVTVPIVVCAPSNKALQVDAAMLHQQCPDIPMTMLVADEIANQPHLKDLSYVWSTQTWAHRQQAVFKNIKETIAKNDDKTSIALDRLDNFLHALGHESHNFNKEPCIKNLKCVLSKRASATSILAKLAKAEKIILEYLSEISVRKLEERLRESRIVLATMATVASRPMRNIRAAKLIVEEAGQATEALLNIPLTVCKPSALILVGDPKQLPATVLRRQACELGYARSTIERLETIGQNCYSLDTQYRMRSGISAVAQSIYPKVEIKNADLIEKRPSPNQLRQNAGGVLSAHYHYTFIDAHSGQEETVDEPGIANPSLGNPVEAKIVIDIYAAYQKHSQLDTARQITIITPYQGQVVYLKKAFAQRYPNETPPNICTVDEYQGGENDVVIISMVRANKEGRVGFLRDDPQRLYVLLTRAREKGIVVGHRATLQQHDHHQKIVRPTAVKPHPHQCFCTEETLAADIARLNEAATKKKSGEQKAPNKSSPAHLAAKSQEKWIKEPLSTPTITTSESQHSKKSSYRLNNR